jgi:hypothetical protein
MKTAGKFPIQEKLLAKPEGFKLAIDSFMHTVYNPEYIAAQALIIAPIHQLNG